MAAEVYRVLREDARVVFACLITMIVATPRVHAIDVDELRVRGSVHYPSVVLAATETLPIAVSPVCMSLCEPPT